MNELFSHNSLKEILKTETIGFTDGSVDRVAIDSREAVGGSLFVPLKGEVTDGNLYLEGALKKGCVSSLVSLEYYNSHIEFVNNLALEYGATFFLVDDGLEALHLLAKSYVSKFKSLKKVAITGSCGKTTTKELIGSIVGKYKKSLITKGNFNSETGLPLTVFRIEKEHEIAVLEMGMSKPGEIKALVDIVDPDIAIITNIGSAHIGFFGSREKIALEKKDVFSNFTRDNIGIFPEWDDFANLLEKDVKGKIIKVSKQPDYISDIKDLGFNGWEFVYEGRVVKLPLIGVYNLYNGLLAISCAQELGTPVDCIVEGLESVRSLFGRGEVLDGNNRVIRDCYNANPESTLNSIHMLQATEWNGEKVAILGSMLELGDRSDVEHLKIVNLVRDKFSKVILCGECYKNAYESLDNKGEFYYFNDSDSLNRDIKTIVNSGSLVLLKASRGVKLEIVTENLL